MRFVDEARIYVRSGKGGDGSRSFRRAKFEPLGGPDGGDGGKGGDVVLIADVNHGTLLDLRFNQHHRAEHGQDGMLKHMYGKSGEDLVVRVPVGTIIKDDETGEILADLDENGAKVIVARGGRGGRGNLHFKSSTNRTPRQAEPGGPFEERWLRLTLKLIADVGLVGFPNAGKSTLISRISAAKPKIADYPFTTLVPNLGVVRAGDDDSFVVADIPGLIEGAAEGAGLGHRFLRHVERVSAICVLLDVSWEAKRHPVTDYETLMNELAKYSPEMLDKPRVIVLSKADLPDTEAALEDVQALADAEGCPLYVISSVTGQGLDQLIYALLPIVAEARAERLASGEPDAFDESEAPSDETEAPSDETEAVEALDEG